MLEDVLIFKISWAVLRDAEETFLKHQKLPPEALTELYSVFGNVLGLAAALLDNCKIIQYTNSDKSRKIYKIGNSKERFTIYDNINFCDCDQFQTLVLRENLNVTCRHVLALLLNKFLKQVEVKNVTVTDLQFVDFLNEQLSQIQEEKVE